MLGEQMFVDWVAEFVVGGRVLGRPLVDGLLDADELRAVELLCETKVLEIPELVFDKSLEDNEVVSKADATPSATVVVAATSMVDSVVPYGSVPKAVW